MSTCLLLAIPDDWRDWIRSFLEKEGYVVLAANSADKALAVVRSRRLTGALLDAEWATATVQGESCVLMKALKGRIPTIAFVKPATHSRAAGQWFYEVYDPPLHEYLSVPVSIEELRAVLKRAGISDNTSKVGTKA